MEIGWFQELPDADQIYDYDLYLNLEDTQQKPADKPKPQEMTFQL